MTDSWDSGNPYEVFMGRWSTHVADKFLSWIGIGVPPQSKWLDVGCGTGTLTRLILDSYQPKQVTAIDSSMDFVEYAKQKIKHPSVKFELGLAQLLSQSTDTVDVVVSGLVLNFVPEPEQAVKEMMRVTKPNGTVGIFLWDYADRMQMLRTFWDAAVELDSKVRELDEGVRFPLCQERRLESLVTEAGLREIEAKPIEVETVFTSFEDYWNPFLGGVGPAGTYAMSLEADDRDQLEQKLRETLPIKDDGSIPLVARAWAVKGIN